MATSNKAEIYKPKDALVLARAACEWDAYRSAEFLDTLSAALAANGDFEQAVKIQTSAIKIASTRELPDFQKTFSLVPTKTSLSPRPLYHKSHTTFEIRKGSFMLRRSIITSLLFSTLVSVASAQVAQPPMAPLAPPPAGQQLPHQQRFKFPHPPIIPRPISKPYLDLMKKIISDMGNLQQEFQRAQTPDQQKAIVASFEPLRAKAMEVERYCSKLVKQRLHKIRRTKMLPILCLRHS